MYDLTQNIREAEEALSSKPLFATSAERILILDEIKSEWKDLPQPLRFSRTLATLLSRVSVPIAPYDLMAGRSVDRELTEEEEAVFQSFIRHPDAPKRYVMLSSGHCMYDWDMLVERGLPGLRRDVEERLSKENDGEKRVFLSAILEIYDAISAYLCRYAAQAEELGMEALADRCRRAATEVPSRFDVALQLLWTVAFIDCAYITENPTLTLGRLDRILWPLYEKGLRDGTLTREDAAAFVTDYYCKHNLIMGRGEHQLGDETNSTTFQRICNFDAPQYLLLAGTDEAGKPAVNALTELFAECIRPEFKNPVVVVRYFCGLNEQYPALWKTLTEKALFSASLMFYNDDNVIKTFLRMGLPEEDVRSYCHFGCNWPSIGTSGAWMLGGPTAAKFNPFVSEEEKKAYQNSYMRTAGTYGWPEIFVNILAELAEKEEGSVTIEDFYAAFSERWQSFLERKLERTLKEVLLRKRRPASVLTFGDCFLRLSLQNAECFAAGAKYHYEIQSFQMFGTLVDSFIVVDRLVFLEKKLTLKRLLEAVRANFEGYEDVLALCRKVEKYGSDTPHSNAHVKRLSRLASDFVIEKNKPYLEKYGIFLNPCMQSDTWHIKYGVKYTATPDGRLAYTPYSQNSRPSNGAAINGLTAMLNAMLNLPSDGYLSGALNLDVDPKQFSGEAGRALFASMLAVYFNRGGLHAQVSSAGAEELIDAQLHPERHRDLRVRVTGYSGIFVDISKPLQDDIIQRFQ